MEGLHYLVHRRDLVYRMHLPDRRHLVYRMDLEGLVGLEDLVGRMVRVLRRHLYDHKHLVLRMIRVLLEDLEDLGVLMDLHFLEILDRLVVLVQEFVRQHGSHQGKYQ